MCYRSGFSWYIPMHNWTIMYSTSCIWCQLSPHMPADPKMDPFYIASYTRFGMWKWVNQPLFHCIIQQVGQLLKNPLHFACIWIHEGQSLIRIIRIIKILISKHLSVLVLSIRDNDVRSLKLLGHAIWGSVENEMINNFDSNRTRKILQWTVEFRGQVRCRPYRLKKNDIDEVILTAFLLTSLR